MILIIYILLPYPNKIYFIAFIDHENRMIDIIFSIQTRLVSEILLETGFLVMAA